MSGIVGKRADLLEQLQKYVSQYVSDTKNLQSVASLLLLEQLAASEGPIFVETAASQILEKYGNSANKYFVFYGQNGSTNIFPGVRKAASRLSPDYLAQPEPEHYVVAAQRRVDFLKDVLGKRTANLPREAFERFDYLPITLSLSDPQTLLEGPVRLGQLGILVRDRGFDRLDEKALSALVDRRIVLTNQQFYSLDPKFLGK